MGQDADTSRASRFDRGGAARASRLPPGRAADWRRHYRVATVWEYFRGRRRVAAAGRGGRRNACVDAHRLRALRRAGRSSAASGPKAFYFVRCRIVSGRFECPPRLVHVAFNAVTCEHALSRGRATRVSRGHAARDVRVGEAPIVAGATSLRARQRRGSRAGRTGARCRMGSRPARTNGPSA